MTTPEQLRQLTEGADWAYFQLFLIAGLLCWFLWLAWRSRRLQSILTRVRAPLPDLSLEAILVLALALRIPHLFDSLWYDEAFTARLASLPLDQLPGAIIGDVHPPLWYAIEWITLRIFGNAEWALRLPALVCGLLLVWLVYKVGLSLADGDVRIARTAALIAALLPALIYYSNEARGYALLACLALTMVYAIRQKRPMLFGVMGGAICLTHNLGYFYFGVLSLYAIQEPVRYVLKGYSEDIVDLGAWLWGIAGGMLMAGLWLPSLLRQSHDIADGWWIQNLNAGTVLRAVTDMTVYRMIPESLVIPIYLVVFALTTCGLWLLRNWLRRTRSGNLLLVLIVGVPGAIVLASLLWHPVYLTRALLPIGAALTFVWADLLVNSPARGLARAVGVPALVLALICFNLPGLGRPDIRAMAANCDGATGAYSTSIAASMFSAYYIDAPLLNWADAGDLNQTLTPDAKAAFGLVSGEVDQLGGDVCLLALETPMTTAHERAYVAALLAKYPHSSNEYPINELYHVNVYRLHLAQEIVSQ